MRIYCDSNIYRAVDTNNSQVNLNLKDCLSEIEKHLLFVYSSAHLYDLKKSVEPHLTTNLSTIEKYAKDSYFFRNHVYAKDEILLAKPTEAYYSIDFKVFDDYLTDPKKNLKHLFTSVENPLLGDIFNNLFDFPILKGDSIADNLDLAELSPFAPLLKAETIGDILEISFNENLPYIEDNKWMAKFKKGIGLLFKSDVPSIYELNSYLDEKLNDPNFREHVFSSITRNAYQKDYHGRFIAMYINLEMYGITQEREKSGNKKKYHYLSINTDANHVYFASFCDYLVSDDKGMLIKASIIYKLLGIETRVLSSKDLINMLPSIRRNEETLSSFFKTVRFHSVNGFVIKDTVQINSKLIKVTYPILNYFDRLQILDSNEILLFKKKVGITCMFNEIQMLINKCMLLFGMDDFGKGSLKKEDFKQISLEENIRVWTIVDVTIKILLVNSVEHGYRICLSLNFFL